MQTAHKIGASACKPENSSLAMDEGSHACRPHLVRACDEPMAFSNLLCNIISTDRYLEAKIEQEHSLALLPQILLIRVKIVTNRVRPHRDDCEDANADSNNVIVTSS